LEKASICRRIISPPVNGLSVRFLLILTPIWNMYRIWQRAMVMLF
jgi:hypothetical protein